MSASELRPCRRDITAQGTHTNMMLTYVHIRMCITQTYTRTMHFVCVCFPCLGIQPVSVSVCVCFGRSMSVCFPCPGIQPVSVLCPSRSVTARVCFPCPPGLRCVIGTASLRSRPRRRGLGHSRRAGNPGPAPGTGPAAASGHGRMLFLRQGSPSAERPLRGTLRLCPVADHGCTGWVLYCILN